MFESFSLLARPRFTVSPHKLGRSHLAVPVGNSIKLDCSAEGHPRPTVRWYKDGALFQQRKGGRRLSLSLWTTVLTMKELVPTDTGKYTCNVSNTYGWINHTYVVDVRGKFLGQLCCCRLLRVWRLFKRPNDNWWTSKVLTDNVTIQKQATCVTCMPRATKMH